jgi:hypothetical protein
MLARDRLRQLAVRGCLIAGVVLLTAAVGPCESQESSVQATDQQPQPERIAVDANSQGAERGGDTERDNPKTDGAISGVPPVNQMRGSESPCDSCQVAAEQRKEAREKADLDAQEIMAIATKDMAEISTWQFWVGLGSLILLFYTLWLTREANRAAIKSAKHAEEAVKVAQDTANRQLRAYVTRKNIEIKASGPLGNSIVDRYRFTVKWINCGSTPALRCVHKTNCDIFFGDLPVDFSFPDIKKPRETPIHIGPNQEIGVPYDIPAEWLVKTVAQTHIVYMWGWIEYDDAVEGKKRHRTEFCMQISATGNPTIDGQCTIENLTKTGFNGMDDGCHRPPQT